ncbi:MAG TPA: hypothetical protein VKA31_11495 [Mariprofundaceae bacterium]|nr:hypothetical protein [Mariprofundaceae bacterium]
MGEQPLPKLQSLHFKMEDILDRASAELILEEMKMMGWSGDKQGNWTKTDPYTKEVLDTADPHKRGKIWDDDLDTATYLVVNQRSRPN